MKTLKPQLFLPSYYAGVEREIRKFFEDLIFRPLFAVFEDEGMEIENSGDLIAEAIKIGKISFEGGVFRGKFNARLSSELAKIGAKYSKKAGGFVLKSAPPASVSMAVASAAATQERIMTKALSVLKGISVKESIEKAAIRHAMGLSLDRMDKDWQKTVEAIGIVPKLTPWQSEKITAEWGQNLELYIQKWTDEKILELRENITPHAFAGGRSSNFAKTIQKDYSVSKAKAKFLARQETSLLLSKYKESRYQEAGIAKYKWSTSADDGRVREDHKLLDGKVFTWDSPPVVDRKTGRRAHAGEDFGCRCVAIPVID